jgi:hypothetical protein
MRRQNLFLLQACIPETLRVTYTFCTLLSTDLSGKRYMQFNEL